MSMPAEIPPYLDEAVTRLRTSLGDDLVGIVLYGSHARGEAREGSDVDLLVIARGLPDRWYDRAARLHAPLKEIDSPYSFSVMGKTPEEFKSHFPSLVLDIGLDGRVLFDCEGYTAEALRRIREITAQAGLRRERKDGEMNWVWQNAPHRHWEITWEGFRELAR